VLCASCLEAEPRTVLPPAAAPVQCQNGAHTMTTHHTHRYTYGDHECVQCSCGWRSLSLCRTEHERPEYAIILKFWADKHVNENTDPHEFDEARYEQGYAKW